MTKAIIMSYMTQTNEGLNMLPFSWDNRAVIQLKDQICYSHHVTVLLPEMNT